MVRKLLAAFAFAFALPAAAQTANLPPDVLELPTPVSVDAPKGKVEVVEFFWYGCPHCYTLEPSLEKWVKDLPKDVEFRRVPAAFNDQWAIAARAYYILEAQGLLDKLHKPLFDAIHKDGLRITNQQAFGQWLEKNGVDSKKFFEAERSFAIESKMKRARAILEQVRIDGVPALMINGKYIIPAGQNMLNSASRVVAMERAEAAKPAAAPKK
jgi:protein dithiol oxidoreductase (disulfide-forming)